MARGATFTFVQGILSAGLGVLYVWALLHSKEFTGRVLFTQTEFGFYTMLSFILTLTSNIGLLALRSASVRYIATYLAQGKEEKARSVVTRVLQVSAVASITIMAVLFILAGRISNTFASSILIFQLLSISSAFQIFYFQMQGFLQGVQKIRELALVNILYTAVQYLLAIFLVYAGFGVLGIVISWVFALSISLLITLLLTLRSIPPSIHSHEFKPLLTFSLPIYGAGLLTFVVNWVDQILVLPFEGTDALGVYSIAVRASVVPNLVSVAIIMALFPKLSELHSSLGVNGLRDSFKTSTRYSAFIGFPVSLMVATLAYPIIVLFATVSYVDAVIPLAVMCIASLPSTLGSAINPTFLTLKRTKVASLITAVSIILQTILSFVSLAYLNLGLVGVALSRLFAACGGFFLGAHLLRSSLKVEFDRKAIWKSATSSIMMVLSLFALEFLRMLLEPNSYQFLVLRIRQLPIYFVIAAMVYLLSLITLRALEKRDIALLRDYLPTKFRCIANLLARVARIKE